MRRLLLLILLIGGCARLGASIGEHFDPDEKRQWKFHCDKNTIVRTMLSQREVRDSDYVWELVDALCKEERCRIPSTSSAAPCVNESLSSLKKSLFVKDVSQ